MLNNSMMIINPYYDRGTWVFDDETTGLVKEPFVAGIPEMIKKLIERKNIDNAKEGFKLTFSKMDFPGTDIILTKLHEENGGNWYSWDEENMEGWLCPALLKYFNEAPIYIFAKVENLTN
tara:strand:- start:73 stop:432 length:360 start_codon:yes stop_codon:yes gene_type:complete